MGHLYRSTYLSFLWRAPICNATRFRFELESCHKISSDTMKLIWSLTTLAISAEAFQKAPGNGSCRGPGGVNDKVNNRFADEIDEDECKAYCEAEPNCNGYAHSAAINEGDCILHGPGLAGTCSDAQYDLRSSCEGAGKTWTGPEAPWKGESWHRYVNISFENLLCIIADLYHTLAEP